MPDRSQITPEAAAILSTRPIGYLGTLRPDGRMSIVPVAVLFDGSTVRVSSLKDRFKIRNLVADSRVTLCVPLADDTQRYVEIRGVATVADDADRSVVNGMAREWMGLDEYPYDPPGSERATITIHPEVVTTPRVQGA